jgi:tetratricopeptide (TPR) repeat protein
VPNRKTVTIAILLILVAIFAKITYTRGFPVQPGAAPAALQGPFTTEEDWVVTEIVRDITEMSAYPEKPAQNVSVTPDLRLDLWAPDAFSAVARAALVLQPNTSTQPPNAPPSVHAALLDLTPATLITASVSISRALATNMRDASAHEAAALILGAFALRESAGRFYDARWAMNRMTAHLAMAIALRGTTQPGIDGQLADAVLSIFTHHQTRALAMLDRLQKAQPSHPVAAWARALRMRITDDTRSLPTPADGSLLEKREYFRARRTTIGMTARLEFDRIGVEPAADWFRVMEASGLGVEDGWLVADAFAWERQEYEEVFERTHRRAIDGSAALNERAGRCLSAAGPEVLPWGAWAEFAQRHMAMLMGKADNFYRHTLGSEGRADAAKQVMTRQLGTLSMFPVATIFWTRGVKGGDADLTFIDAAIEFALHQPERLTPAAWAFLERSSHYEVIRHGIPMPATWFIAPAPRAAYERGSQMTDSGLSSKVDLLGAMLENAPYDAAVAHAYLAARYGTKVPYAEARRVYGPRWDYDIKVLRAAVPYAIEPLDRLALFQEACALSAGECISLGYELADADRAAEAAVAFERAFADDSLDAVKMSNSSGWLVDYYYHHDRTSDALVLAEQSAGTYSLRGLVTVAHLYEHLERFAEAEKAYVRAADRYDDPAQLLGFYYRAVNVRKQQDYDEKWRAALIQTFPEGLVLDSATDAARPPHSVVVTRDNEKVRKAGLQAGDLIVAVEGWRVDNVRQFHAVNAFDEGEQMKLTAWRGRRFPVDLTARNRVMGIEFRTDPIEGWRDK